MPGYLADPATIANQIFFNPQGNISANNIQDAIVEVDNEKAPLASPTFTGTVSASVANISSNLTVDSNTLFVDATNNRVGIGTVSPTQPLQVEGNSFLNGETVVGRSNSVEEGGQISFARASDNSSYWNVDAFGSTSTPTLRFFNDGTVKFQIDSSGRVNMPYQPVFHARGGGSQSISGTGALNIIQINTPEVNIGSYFNGTTYRFTSPVSGNYYFHGKATTSTATSTGPAITLVKNGTSVLELAINYTNINYTTFSGGGIVSLVANDYIQLGVWNYNNTSFTLDTSRCSLTGFLIG